MTTEQHDDGAVLDAEIVDTDTGEITPADPNPGQAIAIRDDAPRRTRSELAMMDRGTDSWTVVVEDVGVLANRVAWTDFVPKSLRGKPAAVGAVILHGREIGLPPMTSLALTHIVEGRPAVSAEGMRALILQAGHSISFVESSSTICTLRGRRAGEDDWTTVTWTQADAQRAGLWGKRGPWQNYPRVMLQARATGELARMLFPDVIHGLGTVEELTDLEVGPVEEPERTTPVARAPRATPARRVTASRQAPAVEAAPETAEAVQEEQTAPSARKATPPPRGRGTRTPGAATPDADPGTGGEPSSAARPASPDPIDRQDAPVDGPGEGSPVAEEQAPPPADTSAQLPVEESPTPARKVSGPQRGAIHAHMKRFGLDGDDEDTRTARLAYLQALAERDAPLTTSSELTADEASKLLDVLPKLRDRAALDAKVEAS